MVGRGGLLAAVAGLSGCSAWPLFAAEPNVCPAEISSASAWATKKPTGPETHVLLQFDAQAAPLVLVRDEAADGEALTLLLDANPDPAARRDVARYHEAPSQRYAGVEIYCGGERVHEIAAVKQVR